MLSSARNKIGKLTPKGLFVRAAIFFISPLHCSTSPEEVSIIPKPPALETAEASWLLAIHPIGAWIMGYLQPNNLVILFMIPLLMIGNYWMLEKLKPVLYRLDLTN